MRTILFLFACVSLLYISCGQGVKNKEKEQRIKDSTEAVLKLKKESDSLDQIVKENRAIDSLAEIEKNKKASGANPDKNKPPIHNKEEKKPVQVDNSGGIHFGQ
jgi:hypothetical protein